MTGYQGISTGWYFAALLARFLTVGLLAGYVVRDILVPERDAVRALGYDDPSLPAACSTTPPISSGSGSTPAGRGSASTESVLAGLGGQVLLQPADVGG